MPLKQNTHCANFNIKHPQPVGWNCGRKADVNVAGNDLSFVDHLSLNWRLLILGKVLQIEILFTVLKRQNSDVQTGNKVLLGKMLDTLTSLSQQFTAMDRRVQENE